MKARRMQYKGRSRDISYNPWLRLVHGRHYDVEENAMRSGKIRIRVTDGFETAREMYPDRAAFDREWC